MDDESLKKLIAQREQQIDEQEKTSKTQEQMRISINSGSYSIHHVSSQAL